MQGGGAAAFTGCIVRYVMEVGTTVSQSEPSHCSIVAQPLCSAARTNLVVDTIPNNASNLVVDTFPYNASRSHVQGCTPPSITVLSKLYTQTSIILICKHKQRLTHAEESSISSCWWAFMCAWKDLQLIAMLMRRALLDLPVSCSGRTSRTCLVI